MGRWSRGAVEDGGAITPSARRRGWGWGRGRPCARLVVGSRGESPHHRHHGGERSLHNAMQPQIRLPCRLHGLIVLIVIKLMVMVSLKLFKLMELTRDDCGPC